MQRRSAVTLAAILNTFDLRQEKVLTEKPNKFLCKREGADPTPARQEGRQELVATVELPCFMVASPVKGRRAMRPRLFQVTFTRRDNPDHREL